MSQGEIRVCYDEWALTYDSDENLTRDLNTEVLRQILPSQQLEILLEAGCGTGLNTAQLSQCSKRVIAVDGSEKMLNCAALVRPVERASYMQCDLSARWPFRDGVFDAVVLALVVQHLPDLEHLFWEIRRVLAVGGWVIITELHPIRWWMGSRASFCRQGDPVSVLGHGHQLSDFLRYAAESQLDLSHLNEWWHPADEGRPPRILSLNFRKTGAEPISDGASSAKNPYPVDNLQFKRLG